MFAAHPGRLELNAQEEIMMQIFSSVLSVLMMVLVLGCSSKGGVNEEGEGGEAAGQYRRLRGLVLEELKVQWVSVGWVRWGGGSE